MPKVKAVEPNYLDSWATVIEKSAELRRVADAKNLKLLKKTTKELNPKTMINKNLLDCYIQTVGRINSFNPKEATVYEEAADKLRKEIMRRMSD